MVVCSILYVKPQSHIHGFDPGRATVHPDLSNRGASASFVESNRGESASFVVAP